MLTTHDLRNLGERLDEAHENLIASTRDAQSASASVAEAQQVLKIGERRIINDHAADPKSLGSNEEARKARIAYLLTEQFHNLATAEARERLAKDSQTLDTLRVKRLQDELRVASLLISSKE